MSVINHLYIIGNGFDKHHGINSGYYDYAEWLNCHNSLLLREIEEKYGYWVTENGENDFWSKFEENLAEINIDEQARYIAQENYPDFSSDHFSREYHASQVEAQLQFENIVNGIKNTFKEWVMSLNDAGDVYLPLEIHNSFFLTFNYTLTLERHYRIPNEKILHIHGSMIDSNFVLGHGKSIKELENENRSDSEPPIDLDPEQLSKWYEEHFDQFYEQAYEAIVQQISRLQKDVNRIIHANKSNFLLFKDVPHIHVYGLSFSEIDMPYIRYINELSPSAFWVISYYKEEEKVEFLKRIQDLNIEKKRYDLVKLKELEHPRQLVIPFEFKDNENNEEKAQE